MASDNEEEILMHLKELSALMMDSINGFKYVTEKVKENKLNDFFNNCQKESYKIWEDINFEIMLRKGDVKTKGTIKGAVNHLWLKIKTDIVHTNLEYVLNNILACEDFNINRYKQVLNSDLPTDLEKKLSNHLQILNSRLHNIEKMASKN